MAPNSTLKVSWAENATDRSRTERLINWLEEHPTERHMLFSDSSRDARAEGRRTDVSKTKKTTYYALIAKYVFENDKDPSYRKHYQEQPTKFVKSVGDRLSTCVAEFLQSYYDLSLMRTHVYSLKKTYRKKCEVLRLSGSGLTWEALMADPEQKNLACR